MHTVEIVKCKRRKRGVTLLEVLISISLICTFMIAFAAVFPASFRLTRKTSTANQAAQYAATVAEELRGLMLEKPEGDFYASKTGKYLEEFCSMDGNTPRYLTTTEIQQLGFPKCVIPEPFTLTALKNTNGGVAVPDGNKTGICVYYSGKQSFWNISVTIYWSESDPGGNIRVRSSTIVTAKSASITTV